LEGVAVVEAAVAGVVQVEVPLGDHPEAHQVIQLHPEVHQVIHLHPEVHQVIQLHQGQVLHGDHLCPSHLLQGQDHLVLEEDHLVPALLLEAHPLVHPGSVEAVPHLQANQLIQNRVGVQELVQAIQNKILEQGHLPQILEVEDLQTKIK